MKNEKFKIFCHFIAGAVLLPIAFKLFEKKQFVSCVILLLAGITFLLFSASLDWLEKTLGNIVKLSFLLETIFLFFAAFIQYKAVKKIPAIAFAVAGIFYFLLFLYYLYGKDKRKKHHRKHHHGQGHSHNHHHHSSTHKNISE
jgi:O-antigen/teichoic acid export membrane protein